MRTKLQKLIFWELNEINFELILNYITQGHLPNWKALIKKHGLQTTYSEIKYENLEPWIQWPSIRTGQPLSQHNIFRLGDIEDSNILQHWEIIEKNGFKVGAISPINGANNTQNSPFWVPDPWVNTRISGKQKYLHRLTAALQQTVNDNAQGKVSIKSILALIESFLHINPLSCPSFIQDIFGALRKQHWSKTVFLERFLTELFLTLWKKHKPDFATLFHNGGAHVQHHYYFNSTAYSGNSKNPTWYVKNDKDPLLEIYKYYDVVLNKLLKLPKHRLIIATGLRQIPHEKTEFYWRPKNHKQFLDKLGIKFLSVHPRMTRDFLIKFNSSTDMETAASSLQSAIIAEDGIPLFGVIEKRGSEIFTTMTYPGDLSDGKTLNIEKRNVGKIMEDVVFVAIKNGKHDGLGYFIDTQSTSSASVQNHQVTDIFEIVLRHFNIEKETPKHSPSS